MGYFYLCMNPKNKTELVKAIKDNANLWLNTEDDDYDYLIAMCKSYAEKYLKLVEEEKNGLQSS